MEYRHSSELFFNEVFYQLTTIYNDPYAAEQVNEYLLDNNSLYPHRDDLYQPGSDKRKAQQYEEMTYKANLYLFGFIWIILKKQKELPRLVNFFLKALEVKIPEDGMPNIGMFKKFYNEHPEPINLSFLPQPDFKMISLDFGIDEGDWECVTQDYDFQTITTIVHRFRNIDERKTVIELIRKYLHLNNDKSGSMKLTSHTTFKPKATDSLLDSLLREADEEASKNEIINTNMLSGKNVESFQDFILKDHQKVLSILMLVCNMGTRQMPLLIKFTKAFQQLGYISKDCFDNLDDFVKKATKQFEGTNFDITNVKKQVLAETKLDHEKYINELNTITHHLKTVMEG